MDLTPHRSLIYSGLPVYRMVMNVLYAGKYRERFEEVMRFVGPEVKRVVELCFGDIRIAEACRCRGIEWQGYDANPVFVNHARQKGFAAFEANLLEPVNLPAGDLCVMMGSFYHFHGHEGNLIAGMLKAAPQVILSEPVRNLSSAPGLVGYLARRAAGTGLGQTGFRFNDETLLSLLDELSGKAGFQYEVLSRKRDWIVRLHHETA